MVSLQDRAAANASLTVFIPCSSASSGLQACCTIFWPFAHSRKLESGFNRWDHEH
jgi:hypothetical protein